MTRVRLTLVALGALALALVGLGQAQAQTSNTVTGTVTYRERIALPSNAIITMQLADVSRADAPAEVIAQTSFSAGGNQPPYSFTLTFDPARINQNGIYSVQGNIQVDGQLRFTTTQRYQVITGGRGTNVAVVMEAAGRPVGQLPDTGSNSWLLGVAAALVLGLVGARLLRSRLTP